MPKTIRQAFNASDNEEHIPPRKNTKTFKVLELNFRQLLERGGVGYV